MLNTIAGRSLVAAALFSNAKNNAVVAVKERALFLSRLLKFEFVYPVGKTFDHIFEETLANLSQLKLIEVTGQYVRIETESFSIGRLRLLALQILDYLESYWAAARVAAQAETHASKKEFTKAALGLTHSEFLAGTVRCAEALSRTNFENALQYLVDQKISIEEKSVLRHDKVKALAFAQMLRPFVDGLCTDSD